VSESFLATQVDARTFGAQQSRLLDDLNRPDLQNIVTEYLQDAMRLYQRRAFFFNDIDNTVVPAYANTTIYPQGSMIQMPIAGTQYVIVAMNQGTSASAGTPAFPVTIFTPPSGSGQFPPPPFGTAGTVDDNGGPPTGIRWATVALFQPNSFTQLSTIYSINQYLPPIDYVSPTLIEVTAASLRYALIKRSYEELRGFDVIRPSPVTVYPTDWAYYQQQIYLWPYPNGFYPLTLSYRTGPQIVTDAGASNFWTTTAERLIRAEAQKNICLQVTGDAEMAQMADAVVTKEMAALRSQQIQQQGTSIPPSDW
jgi:hypothetical protein